MKLHNVVGTNDRFRSCFCNPNSLRNNKVCTYLAWRGEIRSRGVGGCVRQPVSVLLVRLHVLHQDALATGTVPCVCGWVRGQVARVVADGISWCIFVGGWASMRRRDGEW